MAHSVLYASNSNTQPIVATGTTVNLGTVVRKYGCNLNVSGGNVIANGTGYYDVDTNFNFVSGGAGILTIAILKDGVVIPGAIATKTVGDGSTYTFNIPAMFRIKCCCDSTITVVASGVAGNITNASIKVIKE